MGILDFWNSFFAWMPPILYVSFTAFVAIMVIILLFKFIAFLMDVIPFI